MQDLHTRWLRFCSCGRTSPRLPQGVVATAHVRGSPPGRPGVERGPGAGSWRKPQDRARRPRGPLSSSTWLPSGEGHTGLVQQQRAAITNFYGFGQEWSQNSEKNSNRQFNNFHIDFQRLSPPQTFSPPKRRAASRAALSGQTQLWLCSRLPAASCCRLLPSARSGVTSLSHPEPEHSSPPGPILGAWPSPLPELCCYRSVHAHTHMCTHMRTHTRVHTRTLQPGGSRNV